MVTHVALPAPRALDEILSGHARRLVRCRILSGPQAGVDLPVVAGRMTWSYDDPVRLSGGLTVAALPVWSDTTAAAALSPLAGVEVEIATGVLDDHDAEHWWTLGIGRVTQRTVRESPDGIGVDIEVRDRGAIVAQAGAPRSWIITAGSGILAGIASLLSEVAPWCPMSLPLASDTPAASDITLVEKAGDDVWEACRDLARALGLLLTVDETGTIIAPRILLPQESTPIVVPLTGWETSEDGARMVHQVAAQWVEPRPEDADSDWVPDAGTEVVRDPGSLDLPPHVSVITVAYRGDASVLGSPEAARAAATAQLADSLDLVVSGSCESVPHPALVPGSVIERDGWRHRVTRLDIDLGGGPVGVALGARFRDGLAVTLREVFKARTGTERDELVTSLVPLMSRPITEPGGGSRIVEPTDALAGVAVGDPIRVRTDGAGRRVGIALLVRKTIADRHAGESLGSVGGASLTVGGTATLRARASSSDSYVTFSGGDVTLNAPSSTHKHTLPTVGTVSWSAGAASVTVTHGGYDVPLRSAYNSLRNDLHALNSLVTAALSAKQTGGPV